MQREEFDGQPITKQIEYLNNELKSHTRSEIYKSIGIPRTTLSDRVKREGYVFNADISQYVLSNVDVMQLHPNITKVSQKTVKRDVEPIIDGITKEMQKYRDDLMELVNHKSDLLELLEYYRNNVNVINVQQLDMEELPKEYKGNIINKSIKIYDSVYEMFNNLCESYESHKKQDMISLALYQFCKTYEK